VSAGHKRPFSTQLPVSLQHRIRATVLGMQQIKGASYTLSQFCIDALTAHTQKLETRHNDGQPWPSEVPDLLTRGRRLEDRTSHD